MRCSQCQFENPADARFCGKCGAAITGVPLGQGPNSAQESPAVSDGLKVAVAIGSVIFPLLGLVMGGIYMNDANPLKKEAGKLWLYIGLGAIVLWCGCAFLGSMQQQPQRF